MSVAVQRADPSVFYWASRRCALWPPGQWFWAGSEASPGNVLKMQILWPQMKSDVSGTLEMGARAYEPLLSSRSWQIFSRKGHAVNILGFVSHTWISLCSYSVMLWWCQRSDTRCVNTWVWLCFDKVLSTIGGWLDLACKQVCRSPLGWPLK